MGNLGGLWTPVTLQFRTGTLATCNLFTRDNLLAPRL